MSDMQYRRLGPTGLQVSVLSLSGGLGDDPTVGSRV